MTLRTALVALLLTGVLCSGFLAGRATSTPSTAEATCTPSQRVRNVKALAAYRKQMGKQRAAYFRTHKKLKLRKLFVRRQQARLKTLQRAARCTVVVRPKTTLPSTSTTTTTTTPPTTSTTTTTPTTSTTTPAPPASPYGPTLARSLADRPDDLAGAQVHVMYVLPSDGPDRLLDTNDTLKNTVSSFQAWLAAKSGNRRLRMDTYQGSLDISFLRLGRTDAQIASFGAYVRDQVEIDVKAAGFTAPGKLYAVYYDGSSTYSCGGGAWPPELVGTVAAIYLNGTPPGAPPCSVNQFAAPGGPPTYREFSMLHEIMHTLGFVAECAPHHWRRGHVSDNPNDLMWAGDSPWAPTGWANLVLDAGNDDYYKTGAPGCPDFDKSTFLASG